MPDACVHGRSRDMTAMRIASAKVNGTGAAERRGAWPGCGHRIPTS